MMRFAAVGLLAATAVTALAQETYTDKASMLNVALTGWIQGNTDENSATAEKIRITTKDLVNAAGGENRDKLIILTPVDYDGDARVILRRVVDRQNDDTDISGWFGADTLALVENSRTRNNKTTGNQYSVDHFVFGGSDEDPTPFGFDVQGITTANLSNGGFSSNVNGTGYTPAGDGVVSGKVSASGGKNETYTTDGAGAGQ